MPEVSANVGLINFAEQVIRSDENTFDEATLRSTIDHLVTALLGRETQLALLTALVKDNPTQPTEHVRNEYRVTYPRTKDAAEPLDTQHFTTGEEMLDLALYLKQDSPQHADHVIMETRPLFAGPWRKL